MSGLSATTAPAPLGPTSFASVVRKCTASKRTVLIDLDITRVRDTYKTGNGTCSWRELVIRHAQVRRDRMSLRVIEAVLKWIFQDDLI